MPVELQAMRVRTVVLAFVLASTGAASAEKVKTNQETKIYNRPGEQGKVISKVAEGQTITVLSKDGRWLKVRYQGRTGFIPRSKVDMAEGEEMVARNTRRRPFVDGRGKKRGFNGEGGPEDRVGADATGDVARSDDSDAKPTKRDASEDDDTQDKPSTKNDKKVAKADKKPDKKPADKKVAASTKKPADDDDDDTPTKKPADKKAADKKVAAAAVKDDDDDEPKAQSKEDEDKAEAEPPSFHVKRKVDAHEEADPDSAVSFSPKPEDPLFLNDDDVSKATKGKWTEVSAKDGDVGYVLTEDLELGAKSDDDTPSGPTTKRGREIMATARIGLSFVSQTMTATGAATPNGVDQFDTGGNAFTLSLGGGYTTPKGSRWVIGGEATLDIGKSLSGLSFTDTTTMTSSSASFTAYDFNLRALGGLDLHGKRGTVLWARLGYHYQSLLVADVGDPAKNVTKTPSEVIKGPMLGFALTVPRLSQKIGFGINFDFMFGGSLSQTKQLEDGANPSAGMYDLGLAITYAWRPPMNFHFLFDHESQSLSWGAPVMTSARTHTGTAEARSDSINTVTFGIDRAF